MVPMSLPPLAELRGLSRYPDTVDYSGMEANLDSIASDFILPPPNLSHFAPKFAMVGVNADNVSTSPRKEEIELLEKEIEILKLQVSTVSERSQSVEANCESRVAKQEISFKKQKRTGGTVLLRTMCRFIRGDDLAMRIDAWHAGCTRGRRLYIEEMKVSRKRLGEQCLDQKAEIESLKTTLESKLKYHDKRNQIHLEDLEKVKTERDRTEKALEQEWEIKLAKACVNTRDALEREHLKELDRFKSILKEDMKKQPSLI